MLQIEGKTASAIQLIDACIDIFVQLIYIVMYRQLSKLYVREKDVVVYLYYTVRMLGDVFGVGISITGFSSSMTAEKQFVRQTVLEISLLFFSKSLPCALMVLLCAIQVCMLLTGQARKRVAVWSIIIVTILIIVQVVLGIVLLSDGLRSKSHEQLRATFFVQFWFDLGMSVLYVCCVIGFFLGVLGKRRDYLLIECLRKVHAYARCEAGLFAGYVIISAIYTGLKLTQGPALQRYTVFIAFDAAFHTLFGVIYGLVFIPPTRVGMQEQRHEIELLTRSSTQALFQDRLLDDGPSFDLE